MPRSAVRVCLMAALATASVSGCATPGPAYPPDPLFISKKPVETAVENAAPAAIHQPEAAVPAIPATVLAALHREPGTGGTSPVQALETPMAGPRRLTPEVHAAEDSH
jgi:hypothetical protein